MDHVVMRDDIDMFKMLYKPKRKWKPLNQGEGLEIHTAAMYEDNRIFKLLVSLKADINTPSNPVDLLTPLHLSVLHLCYNNTQALLKAGADPNCKDCDSETPILFAAGKDNLPLVKLLIEHGADPMIMSTNKQSVCAW